MTNNVYELSDHSTVEAQARKWLIKLDGDTPLTHDEISALHEWISHTPANRQELKRISEFWNRANILTELAVPLYKQESRRTTGLFSGIRPLLFTRHWVTAMVIVFVLVIPASVMVTSWSMLQPDTASNGIYGTAVGKQQFIDLIDGSVVQLNTDSQIQVSYSNDVRKITLLRGEAHFNVNSNPDIPFEVYAGKALIKAVGTAFAVHLMNEEIEVTVTEGQVALAVVRYGPVIPSADKAAPSALGSLKSGQSATFSNEISEISDLAQAELLRQLAWREGLLVFAGEPLSEVVAEINRYTPMTIEIEDPSLETVKVGGRFTLGELEAAFDVLETSFGIQVSRINDQHILLLPSSRQ